MNTSDITGFIKTILPTVGTALAGPVGGGVATFIASKLGLSDSTVENVTTTVASMLGDPTQIQKLKELDTEYKELLIKAGVDLATLEAGVIKNVNETMRAEAASDHWPTFSWRPYIGFCFGTHVLGFVVLPLFSVTPPPLPPELYIAIGGILGVASWFRGKMQADPNIPTDNRG